LEVEGIYLREKQKEVHSRNFLKTSWACKCFGQVLKPLQRQEGKGAA
jgi:hypothetical protein